MTERRGRRGSARFPDRERSAGDLRIAQVCPTASSRGPMLRANQSLVDTGRAWGWFNDS